MKIYSCYSIKGGVGKTALAVNLAAYLRELGERTLLIDLDPQGAAAFYFRIAAPATFEPDGRRKLGAKWALPNLRESDYPGLDLLPSHLDYRHLDLLLAEMKKPRRQLSRTLERLEPQEYDAVVIDCPPGITLLSENIFRASTRLLVPVIPTPLSVRTLDQLHAFLQSEKLDPTLLTPFFSMVQSSKKLHRETMESLCVDYPQFLKTAIPFSSEVEKMGVTRQPLLAGPSRTKTAAAYRALCEEITGSPLP